MKEYQAAEIRHFAIVGRAYSGKTMLSEAMMASAGVINRMGSIASGSTVSDYHENEQQRQISVSASLMHCEWLGKKFNIIDCPGYADFISEGLGALRVGDFALVVVNASHGVGVGTDAVWKYATQFGLPKFIVLKAFDKENTNFEQTLTQVREHYGARAFPLSLTALLWIFRSNIFLGFTTIPGWSNLLPTSDLINDGTVSITMALILFLIPSKSEKENSA